MQVMNAVIEAGDAGSARVTLLPGGGRPGRDTWGLR
jgi:hypothetical protein